MKFHHPQLACVETIKTPIVKHAINLNLIKPHGVSLYFSYKTLNPLAIREAEDDIAAGGPALQGYFLFFQHQQIRLSRQLNHYKTTQQEQKHSHTAFRI
jgi:hypothetical protein